ncbi:hypothetical protein Tco_0217876 [Tanacetum coccineum]
MPAVEFGSSTSDSGKVLISTAGGKSLVLEAYSDSDYAGSHGDRKSTTGGCQILGRRLISWQCKKQTIVATSSTEAEYVAAASCCAQVLWIQNQLLDYGFNFMNTKIFIDNQSTICIVKNPVFHQRTKHIEIRHHFIRDANEKNLIQVLKIHTDDNVADLLTKAFDGPRFEYLVVHIGMVDMVLDSAGSTMFLLVVIISAGCFISAGSYGLCCWVRVHAGGHTSAGGFISADKGLDIAGWLVSATSHLVSAGSIQSCWWNIYKDDHNKIAYLGRESGSEDFTDILSYLDHSTLRYALTHDPSVVFDFLVVVTESLIRAQLQLDDANGIFDMQIDDILEGMGVIGYPTGRTLTFLKHHLSPQWRFLGQPIPLTPPMLAIAAAGDAADEENAAAHEAAGSTAEAHPAPHSPPFSPVRESTPERQPETEWVVPNPVSPGTDWRPWPSVPAHSPIRDHTNEPASPPTPPAQTVIFEVPLVFGPAPRPAGYVDPDTIDQIIYGPHPHDTILGGFHEESPAGPDDAPTPTADAAGRAEDPALLTSLSAKIDRCMGRIDSLETELGTSKKIMGGAILTLVSRVKKLERTVKQLRTARLVGDAPATEGDVDIQDDVDLEGLSRMASEALGHDQAAVPSEDMEEREEEEVPLRRKRSVYRRARTEFHTPAFAQFQTPLSADVLSQAAVSESAGPSVVADKGKAPMPDLDIPAEFVAEDAQARQRFEEDQASQRLVQRLQAEDLAQEYMPNVSEERAKELDELMMRMTETDWLNLMMQVGSNPALARELLGADVTEENFVERMTAIKDKKKRALADLRYRALKGKPMKQSEVTQMMRTLVKNQWCAAHNGTISMTAVKAMSKQQLIEEYENICRRLEKDRLLSAQYNLFRPKPAISEPPSKRQRVARASSQPSNVPAATTQPADDHDSAGGSSFHPAGSAPPLSGSAAPTSAGGVFGVPDSTVSTSAAMDSAGSHRESGVSPFADSADSSSPSPVSTDHISIDGLLVYTSGGINDFFLDSDEDAQIGMSRVAADPDSEDDVLAEILFRGKYISGAGVVVVDKLPDDEIVDPRVKVETVSDYASSPPRSRRKHRGVRSDDFLWDKPVEDFFSSESESDDDMETYIPPLPYGAFKDWEIVRCPLSTTYYHVYYQENRRQKSFFYLKQLLPHVYREDLLLLRRRMNRYFRLNPDVDVGLDLWRDVNLLCQSLHSDDVEDFWRTQDEWVVSSWKLYPRSSVHVLDLTNGKTVYMFVDNVYPIRATLLERMLRHRLTVPPSYCRDVVVAGSVIQMVQAGLRESYECLASAPLYPKLVVITFHNSLERKVASTIANGSCCFYKPGVCYHQISTSPRVSKLLGKKDLSNLLSSEKTEVAARDLQPHLIRCSYVSACFTDAAVAYTVSAACCVAC